MKSRGPEAESREQGGGFGGDRINIDSYCKKDLGCECVFWSSMVWRGEERRVGLYIEERACIEQWIGMLTNEPLHSGLIEVHYEVLMQMLSGG